MVNVCFSVSISKLKQQPIHCKNKSVASCCCCIKKKKIAIQNSLEATKNGHLYIKINIKESNKRNSRQNKNN